MDKVDTQLLQAHVVAQGILIRALIRAAADPNTLRFLCAEELEKAQAGLMPDMLAFVYLQVQQMMRALPQISGARG
ncbi:MAG: hypothetical protein ABIX37_03055 [Gammaproteobacteria bacterium]